MTNKTSFSRCFGDVKNGKKKKIFNIFFFFEDGPVTKKEVSKAKHSQTHQNRFKFAFYRAVPFLI